ncbi:hypothetical protein SAMN04488510_10316 [Fervidobacterium changbaicum]|uniref:Uncharacterized protein n=2 Tax=Fervidobacterium TaxID=2422 RepID=A0AAI8CM90_FERIS|nr:MULTISPECIES: hypothetical protein [Fervidobacterium]AMW32961.1 hypothetical protein NA23_06645 [Fervidobacterium islandicum]QAV33002.1 hypothetical protein CBS1_04150 [Fervidobacterium changbaicum]SDH00812.1 hypothetical protein SAMN04488510_10316 [Fervidobacterium changbaicum]
MEYEYYLCEISHKNGAVRIAIQGDLVLGVSDIAFPAPEEIGVFGFALHDGYLYPVVTHSNLQEPVFKYYLILKEFAFGVTRIVQKTQAVPIPLSPDIPTDKSEDFKRLTEYTGVIVLETDNGKQELFYVYNTFYISLPKTARIVKQEIAETKSERHFGELRKKYIVIGNKFALPLENVLTILSADIVTPFKTEQWDGFIDYERTIPVRNMDEGRAGKFVVVTQSVGYRTSKVGITEGKVLTKETADEKYLETPDGIFKIIE